MNDEAEIRRRVLACLEADRPLPCATEEEKLRYEYLDAGFVDSVKIVELVARLEDDFGIRFEPGDMQSEDFRTVGGLVRLIRSLLHA